MIALLSSTFLPQAANTFDCLTFWPYFEEKARINSALEAQKARIQTLEEQVAEAKQQYSSALRNLERISDEIHKHRSRRQSNVRNNVAVSLSTLTDTSDTNTSTEEQEDQQPHDNVREWLRRANHHNGCGSDNWTEVDLDYSSPEEVSFEKCSLRALSPSDKLSPVSPVSPQPPECRVSASSPRRIILCERNTSIKAELDKGRRQSLDALLHDTSEKVKDMFQGLSLFGERRGSVSMPRSPRTPRRSPPDSRSTHSDERHSDTDSLASVEMLTDEQIASLMLDAQLHAACERLASSLPAGTSDR